MTDAPKLSRLGQAALAYAEMKWPVFTCFPKGKKPMNLCPDCDERLPGKDKATGQYPPCKVCGAFYEGKRGLYFATTDPAKITRWWTKEANANVGIATGNGLLVLDVDVPSEDTSADGEATLAKLVAQYGALPATPVQRTGQYKQADGSLRRGWQYFLKVPHETHNTAGSLGQVIGEDGRPLKDDKGRPLSSGLDTRGDGGYVVAAPSVHPSKVNYEWVREPADARPSKMPVADAPAWLLDLMKPQKISERASVKHNVARPKVTGRNAKYMQAVVDGEFDRVAAAGPGTRNAALNKAAFKLGQYVGGKLLDEKEARMALEAGAEACGWAQEEGTATVAAVISSGLTAGIDHPRTGPEEREPPAPKERGPYQPPAGEKKAELRVVGGQEQPEAKKAKKKKGEEEEAKPVPKTGWTIEDWPDHCVFKADTQIFVPKAVKNAIACLLYRAEFADLFVLNKRSQSIIITRQPPWTHNGGPYPRKIGDTDIVGFQAASEKLGLRLNKSGIADAIAFAARERESDPVLDSLNKFVWDKEPRLDFWLSTYLGVEEDSFTKQAGAKWMMAAVARILRPGCKFDYMLVLEGKQGLMKSTALRVLAEALAPDVFSDRLSPLKNKDSMIELLGKVIVEIAELAAFKGTDVDAIKRFLSAQEDDLRLPWDRTTSQLPRGCVFAGTRNPDLTGWLTDPTGGRRFWCVDVRTIDIARLRKDAPQLWAEAKVRYLAGEAIWIDDKEVERVAEEAISKRMDEDVWAKAIDSYIEGKEKVTVAAILSDIGVNVENQKREHSTRVLHHLRRRGWRERFPKIEGKTTRAYIPPVRPRLFSDPQDETEEGDE